MPSTQASEPFTQASEPFTQAPEHGLASPNVQPSAPTQDTRVDFAHSGEKMDAAMSGLVPIQILFPLGLFGWYNLGYAFST